MSIYSTIHITVPANLAEVISVIKADATISANSRRDLISAINRTALMFDCKPVDIHAHVPSLRRQYLQVHPTSYNLTSKSLSNIKSCVARSLVLARVISETVKPADRTDAWRSFLQLATVPHQAFGLGRLASWCSLNEVEPADVTDATIKKFGSHLDYSLLTNDPRKVCKDTVLAFNRLNRSCRTGFFELAPLREGQFRARPMSDHPLNLRQDLTAYLDRLSHADRFSEEGPIKALQPSSLRNTEAHVRQYLDALSASGLVLEHWHMLADITHPELVKQAFGVIIERNCGEPPVGLKNLAGTLLAIARHYSNAPKEHIDFLQRTITRLSSKTSHSEYGMSEKNVIRLGQFNDWRNVVRLIALPEQLLKKAQTKPQSRRHALDAMFATAISILLACPMRAKNLASLDVEKHITWRMIGNRKRYSLRIEGQEVKNLSSIDVDLGPHASDILTAYLKDFRRLVSGNTGTALFPRLSGGPRDPANLAREISSRIDRETGLKVHAHLFRHIAAKLYLDRAPGDYETVRRILGHKRLDTTMKFYARIESKFAFKQYDEKVLSHFRGKKDD